MRPKKTSLPADSNLERPKTEQSGMLLQNGQAKSLFQQCLLYLQPYITLPAAVFSVLLPWSWRIMDFSQPVPRPLRASQERSRCVGTHHGSIVVYLFEPNVPVSIDLSSVIEEVKRFAISSRREAPIPSDFELMLRHHNLTLSSLKPHIKGRLSNQDTTDRSENLITIDDTFNSLPLLGDELSGQPDKESKTFIPSSFPGFPSTHTYKFTPQEDRRTRDSKQIREDAAKSAQLGEDALRRLVRASKMRKQKEVKSLVERDSQGKERFRLWESTMKRFMGGDRFRDHADKVEIADHSMLVNADTKFSRREVSRLGKKPNVL